MKKIITVISLLSALILCGCGEAESNTIDPPKGTAGVTNEAVSYILYYPSNWNCEQSEGLIVVAPSIGSETSANISVNQVSMGTKEVNLVDYWKAEKEKLQKNINAFSDEGLQDLTLCDTPAVKATFKGKINDTEYKFVQIYCYKNNDLFTITLTSDSEDFNSGLSALSTVVENFKFKS